MILVLSRDRRQRSAKGKTSDIGRDEFIDSTLGIWTFPGRNTTQYGHPAPFPEELPRRLIQLFSFRDDVALDPFLGSGTTCRVARTLGRGSIGVEIDHASYPVFKYIGSVHQLDWQLDCTKIMTNVCRGDFHPAIAPPGGEQRCLILEED